MIDGRAKLVLLIETAVAAARIREIAAVRGVEEIMVGLNDLHIKP
jgi:2-keto-3-deoxy-L-rhamnonate aldolase RhmA